MKALRTTPIVAGILLVGAFAALPAKATTVTWTLGTDSYTGVAGTLNCTSHCNSYSIGYGQASFASDVGSVPLLLSAFSTTSASGGKYYNNDFTRTQLTQKPGTGSESGVGATYGSLRNPDGEIQLNEAVLVDAATLAAGGYTLNSLTIGSIQKNEGFTIYGLDDAAESAFLSAMNDKKSKQSVLPVSGSLPSGWAVVASYQNTTGCGNVAGSCTEESVNLGNPANPYYLITDAGLHCSAGDVILSSAGATANGSHNPPPSVPEPASMALLAVGLAGIVATRRRSRSQA